MKMQNTAIYLIAIALIISIGASTLLMPTATAHYPGWEIPTYAYISVAPDPIGVGQTASVYMWLDKLFADQSVQNDYRFHNFILNITSPNGTKTTQTFDYISDTTSSQGTTFTPSEVGVYTLTFSYLGQSYTDYSHSATSAYVNDTYLPSSASTTLTVQEEPIPSAIFGYPLPTEYWTRPIEGQNANWYTLGSNYVDPNTAAYSFGAVRYVPDAIAPNSGHIMWTKPIQFGGIVGGLNTGDENGTGYYTGLSYETRFQTPIILNGRLYFPLPESGSGTGGGYTCLDMRTGNQIWQQNYTVNPSFASLVTFNSGNQHGVVPNGYLWATTTSGGAGNTWMAFDPWDGNWLFNITNVPSGTRQYGPNGEPEIYELNAAGKWLALWNFTNVITNGPLNALTMNGYRPVGQVFNSTTRASYSWNVTIPTLPSSAYIKWAIDGDILLGSDISSSQFGGVGQATSATFFAISLKPSSLGTILWTKTITPPAGNITLQLGQVDPVNRVFIFSTKETMQWYGYDLDSGNLLWGPLGNARAFNYYSTIGMGSSANQGYVAYNNFYVGGYGGEIFCYDTRTGTLQWKYNNTNGGFQTPYGNYPTFVGLIADGKVYVYNGEHSPNQPLYKDEKITCLNATTGDELWDLDSWVSVGPFADWRIPVADGYMAYFNTYDGQIYSLGKGPSKLTVTAPDVGVTTATPVTIRGTITDIAAGTTQEEQAARFPNGVPCVSDASQSSWMEYVYMQKPKPTNTTGVLVTLYVIDANNNYRPIGETTSDDNGFYSYAWNPDIAGKYTLIAKFEGSESYWPSQAVSAFTVSEPASTQPPPESSPSVADQYFVPAVAGLFVAIIVVGALLAILLLKKRP
jgi:outer membrane protein assembly factor BamB